MRAPAEGEFATDEDGLLTSWITFETAVARGYGLIRIKEDKIWTLLSASVELKGHEEPLGFERPMGAKHGFGKHKKSWAEEREQELAELGYKTQPEVVIIGGGQGGIALGARLRQLGVATIIIEKNERAGDSWRKRYKSLCLHDPVWYDHLPYLPFPANWPIFAPKDKLGAWLGYAQGSRSMGRRGTQYVEADAAGGVMVSRWQPASVSTLLLVPCPPAESSRCGD